MKIYKLCNSLSSLSSLSPQFHEGDKVEVYIKGSPYIGFVDFSEEWGAGDFRYYIKFDRYKEFESSADANEQEIAYYMEDEIKEQDIVLIEKGEDWDKSDTILNLKDNEIFHFGARSWDVRNAKRIIYKNPREMEDFMVEGAEYLINGGMINTGGDWKNADLSIPLILITTQQGMFPIDGWHRIRRAMEEGVNSLPCFILSEEESKSVEV